MAEETEMGGVIIPSHIRVPAPIIAGQKSHFPLRCTSAYREKIPPSPLLSALNVRKIYLKVVWLVRVQMTHDKPPRTRSSEMGRSPMMALIT